MITFNSSQAHPFQKFSVMQKLVAIKLVCICALVSGVNLNLALPRTFFSCSQPCKQTVNISIVSHPSCTHKLHQQIAYICITQIILSNCIFPAFAIACRAVSCIVLFSCCAMRMFPSQHEKNMERECWNQNLSDCTDQPSWLACGQCN